MRKLGYIRVSTDKQVIDRQLDQLQDYCDEVFIEDGVSALSKKRPAYDEVMQSLKEGDIFVVSSLDRAFRSVQDALSELDKLHKRSIEFLSLSQNFNTTTPDGKFFYTLAAALAAWEREILSVRTKQGMKVAREKGKLIGRPPKLNDNQLAQARSMLHAKGKVSIADIAKQFNVHERTLKRALQA